MKFKKYSLCTLLTILLLTGTLAHGTVLKGAVGRNLDAPTGDLADSGWDLQGQWRTFLGTPISSTHFITAKHVGGTVGNTKFVYDGQEYDTTAVFTDPNSDLAIWQVDGTFSSFAPLYTKSDEEGQDIVFFGRGSDRGDPVTVGASLKGWEWTSGDNQMSWGQNTVTEIFTNDPDNPQTLRFTFDLNAGPNEAQLTGGDSGGGAFILDEGVWKLAGINYAATGSYQFTADESEDEFSAALFDESGLFVFDSVSDQWVPATGLPGSSFVTRISTNVDWINSPRSPNPQPDSSC